jgi:hypothetical protein
MIIFKHRSNNLIQLCEAHSNGYGVEIDVRSSDNMLKVDHDTPVDKLAENLYAYLTVANYLKVPVLLNVKETGLIPRIAGATPRDAEVYLFDLVYPDYLAAEKAGLKTLIRKSKYEDLCGTNANPMYWLDYCFSSEEVTSITSNFSNCVLASPELHKKTLTEEFVNNIKNLGLMGVCTKYPEMWL